ncbi:mitogen-activated protein kinase kinase kinase 19 isoform X2 [Phyllopteryx taeniolatus]|uniref:mitogen-activated protein kinase kinase kinase 19 isoform X2 n=1 Tax=Phyllopteryx taeniolatus TaxID=161469 RepID=UPI002AD4B7E5|nr:mitogen-activated protein kinase kinase kinase 19 isoform X2 [Phyllopteryx taeniolatus]
MLRTEQEVEDLRDVTVSISQEAESEDDLEVSNAEDEEEQDCNPLIKACRDGNTEAAEHLLQAGADATLCNGSKKTALHVSPPGLQKKLMGWMRRPHLSPQAELLQASWQGDLRTVQRLLTDKVEVNVPNSDGATSVILAIRDIDLFEGMAPLPWEHRPVQVVKQLLRLSANLWLRDHSGCSALHYLGKINSPMKEDILHMMLDAIGLSDAGTASPLALEEHDSGQDLDSELGLLDLEFDLESISDQSTASSPTQLISQQDQFLAYSHSEETFDSSGCQPDHCKSPREDKEDDESPHGVQNATETLMDLTQASQEAVTGSRGTLPSMDNKCRRPSQMDPVPSSRQLTQRSNRLPVSPTHRQRTRSVADASPSSLDLLSVAEPSKLSQSAPSIMEPLLCANYVFQARTHIQTRLGSHQPSNQQKVPVLALQPPSPFRMPKQLEPLDLRLRDNSNASVLKQSVPLKPISKSPLSRTHLRQRFSWGTPRTSTLTTRVGSDDSGSSANLTDLEDEDYERDIPKDIDLMFTKAKDPKHPKGRCNEENIELYYGEMRQSLKSQSKSGSISLIHKSTCILRPEPVNCQTLINRNNATHDYNTSPVRDGVKHKTPIPSKPNYYIHNGCTKTAKQDSTSIKGYFEDKPATEKDYKIDEELSCKTKGVKLNSSSAVEETQLKYPINNQRTDLKRAKVKKALKPAQSTESRKESSANCQLRTNLPITRLGHKDRSILNLNKSPKKLSLSNKSTDDARRSPEQIVVEEVTDSLVKSKLKSVNRTCNTPLPWKRGTVSAHSGRANPDKVCNSRAQQCPTVSELKNARQFKSPEAAGPQRSKSAVDFITYKDMFTTIQSEGKGPAIYEMFAGPIYDNIRNPISSEDKQLQSAPSRKSRENRKVKYRPLKQVQTKIRRSPTEKTVVSTKGKTKPLSPRIKHHLTHATKGAHKQEINTKPETTVVFSNDGDIGHHALETPEGPILSTIEEDLYGQKSETLKTDEKAIKLTCKTSVHLHKNIEETSLNPADIRIQPRSINQMIPESSKNTQIPMTDTWTSDDSSGHMVMSPVYQKFLNGVGDGPLTDDLLQCLAEELNSLDEKDISIDAYPQNLEMEYQKGDNHILERNDYLETMSMDLAALHGSGLGDIISWTKGEVLGRGAYGTVYCGLTNQGQLIAVKQVTLDASDPEAARREYSRLQGEVKLLKTLSHANIVGFRGTSLYQHMVSIFMEYIPGGSIASILHRTFVSDLVHCQSAFWLCTPTRSWKGLHTFI